MIHYQLYWDKQHKNRVPKHVSWATDHKQNSAGRPVISAIPWGGGQSSEKFKFCAKIAKIDQKVTKTAITPVLIVVELSDFHWVYFRLSSIDICNKIAIDYIPKDTKFP